MKKSTVLKLSIKYYCSKQAIEDVQCLEKVCVLDIEIQGVKQIKNSSLDPFYVFIKPPSIAELERRLITRNTESKELIECRLAVAKIEIEYGMYNILRVHNKHIKTIFQIHITFMLKTFCIYFVHVCTCLYILIYIHANMHKILYYAYTYKYIKMEDNFI
jgi:guanylate kinase